MKDFQKICEPIGARLVLGNHPRPTFSRVQLRHEIPVQGYGLLKVPAAEAEAEHGVAHRPIPMVGDVQSLERRLIALEQFLQGIQEQALSETSWPG